MSKCHCGGSNPHTITCTWGCGCIANGDGSDCHCACANQDGSIDIDDPRAAVSWIVSPVLMIPRLAELWGRRGTAWMADSFAEFTRRSLTAR